MKPKVKVKFTGVSKKYNLYKTQSEKLIDLIFSRKSLKEFYALRNISFEVYEGETIGIIGINGSGKSTLSNLLAQVIPPSSGEVEINGDTSLIAISAGLNNNLSGIENIKLKCLMLGFKQEDINHLIPQIIEFADIGEFIEQPVKNYSSGMKSRLGFAISAHTDPDILVIDEALSVGDQTFYEKCLNKVNEFKAQGKTIFFISHSVSQVRSFSDRIIWLHFGQIHEFGRVGSVVANYKDFIQWFNSLDNGDKKKYRKEKLQEQMSSNQRPNVKDTDLFRLTRSSRKKKNGHQVAKASKNWLFTFQVTILTLCMLISLGFMFNGVDNNILSYFNNKYSSAEQPNPIIKSSDEEQLINSRGMVLAEDSILYEDKSLTIEKEKLDFTAEVFVMEKTMNLYKVKNGNSEGYMESEDVHLLTSPISPVQVNFEEILDSFPERFAGAYQFFLAQLNTESTTIINTLNGLTEERTNQLGSKELVYDYNHLTIIMDKDDIANKLIISDINLYSHGFKEIISRSQLHSSDERQFLVRAHRYDLILDINKKELMIALRKD